MNNICCIFNIAAHYRESIFRKMDAELGCDFYLGDKIYSPIKLMDYKSLENYKGIVKFLPLIKPMYWQQGSVKLVFKSCYRDYLIDGEMYNLSNWAILILGKLIGKRVCTWQHGWYGRETFLKKIIKKIQAKLAYHIFVYGDYARELMIKENIRDEKISCIYNSLDYDAQLALRNKLQPSAIFSNHFSNNFHNLIFIGRLTPQKKLDTLLTAVAELRDSNSNYNLTYIGDGMVSNDLEKLVEKLNLKDRVWFYGACYSEDELSTLLYNADLCVSPGNVGLTAIHAMSYGTPVVTHDNFPYQMPEFETIEVGETGGFFRQNDVDSLTCTIQNWFCKNPDREEIRKNCYEVIDTKYNPYYQIKLLKTQLNENKTISQKPSSQYNT